MRFIENFLDQITMYRLVLYYLTALILNALIFSFLGIISFSPFSIIFSTAVLVTVSFVANKVFAKIFNAPTNIESLYISALILALIITPSQSIQGAVFLGLAGFLAMASKYILAINKKHIFNPAAIAVFLIAIAINQPASWWVGSFAMIPITLLGGLLMVKKIQKTDLVFSFLVTTLFVIVTFAIFNGSNLFAMLNQALLHSALLFFALIMLTEPSTTPPAKKTQVGYGILVGILYSSQLHIQNFDITPEMALLTGNIFSYLVSPKQKLILFLKEKIQIAPDIFDFVFTPKEKFSFAPGQYMEWTFQHPDTDARGNRRYFTIASSPTENELRFGIKFYPQGSSFKNTLINIGHDVPIVSSQLTGDFTLPKDEKQKLVFIAGGIGITPFRSIIKYLVDVNEKRGIILIFTNRQYSDIIYGNIFDKAKADLGIKTIYTLTDESQIPKDWSGKVGRIDEKMIREEIPDFRERIFYLSGPHSMVNAFEKTLLDMGISKSKIKTDFFPGYA
ncbi:MAG: RnfABCDGE type electron transport complex subunit D [Patescibacteria group bacterium]